MRVLLVVDPIRDDGVFMREIADAAIAGLWRAGHDVDVVDLVERQYSPVMTTADRRAYFSDDPLTCSETSAYAELVGRADSLVFVYPSTLSMVTPGIKGWVDRTFVPGVAFTLGDRTGSKRGLSNIRHLTGIAVYDESRLDVLRQGDNGRRLIRRSIRLCGGLRTRSRWIAMYGCADADDHDRDRFLVDVERRMARS